MQLRGNWNYPTAIRFGAGRIAELPEVVARVNGEAINKADLQSAVTQLESRAGRTVPPDQRDRVFRGVLDQLIAYRLLAQESVTRNIAVSDGDVDARTAEIRKQFPSDQVFQQTLEQQHMTEAEFRDDVRQGLRITGLIDAELSTRAGGRCKPVVRIGQPGSSRMSRGSVASKSMCACQ